MPHRFQLFEKIAFSLVCWSAAACSAFIAYERCPDIQVVLHAGEEVLRTSGEYSFVCASPVVDSCTQLATN
ncbi:hypothetical protein PQQ88_28295 [Paraburkholderia caledonica]|jgi:hypothetical protein|uniref:hypothetical protein n=1 Tax=Paraburkholderia caledonica TaxID=134536 RepID=UPI000DEF3BAC|nr:hypothetical protein [Paraburkholderia caledonica]AXF14541.1 hypothetical protein CUJ87_09100 [Paraburkholderia caledonica]